MRHVRLHSASSIACLLVACGGGGGPSGDFGNGLAIDTSALSFSAEAGIPPPPVVRTVHATISASDAATLEVGYTNGNEAVSWLQATIDARQNPATVSFTVLSVVSPGTFTAHPSIGIFRADHTPIAVRALTVTYQVAPQMPGVSSNKVALTTQFNSTFTDHYALQVRGSSPWTATVDYVSGANWLKLFGSTTYPQSGPGGTWLDLSPVSSTAVGSYSAILHVAIGTQVFDVAVTLDVTP